MNELEDYGAAESVANVLLVSAKLRATGPVGYTLFLQRLWERLTHEMMRGNGHRATARSLRSYITMCDVEENAFAELDAMNEETEERQENVRQVAQRMLNDNKMIAFTWSIEDVQGEDYLGRTDLNDEQAWEILQEFERRHDCSISDWDELRMWADDLYPPKDMDAEN